MHAQFIFSQWVISVSQCADQCPIFRNYKSLCCIAIRLKFCYSAKLQNSNPLCRFSSFKSHSEKTIASVGRFGYSILQQNAIGLYHFHPLRLPAHPSFSAPRFVLPLLISSLALCLSLFLSPPLTLLPRPALSCYPPSIPLSFFLSFRSRSIASFVYATRLLLILCCRCLFAWNKVYEIAFNFLFDSWEQRSPFEVFLFFSLCQHKIIHRIYLKNSQNSAMNVCFHRRPIKWAMLKLKCFECFECFQRNNNKLFTVIAFH